MTDVIVADSACLIALDRIGMLHLLEALYQRVLIPPAVQPECGMRVPWLWVVAPADTALVRALRLQVHTGEAEAIALAIEKGVACILDDARARRTGRHMGVPIVGTIGIILRAKREGIIDAVRPVFEQLTARGFYMGPGLMDEALRLAGE